MDSLVSRNLFNGIYKGTKVLITGVTGFKGSWLAHWLKAMGAEVTGIGLPPENDHNHFDLLNLDFQDIDIREFDRVYSVITQLKPDIVFHLAAQAFVRRSFQLPIQTYETNVLGTLNVYKACLDTSQTKGIVSITSDKVYENKDQVRPYRESDELGGLDMYSSSKACVELLSSSFGRSFFGRSKQILVTARAGNVIGGGDWGEDRLIPDVVRSIMGKYKVSIRSPLSTRPWQHVLDPLSGYLLLGKKVLEQDVQIIGAWNFAPIPTKMTTVDEVLKMAAEFWDVLDYEVEPDKTNSFEAHMLSINSSKAIKALDWTPVWNVEKAIKSTITWYKNWIDTGTLNTWNDTMSYINDAERIGVSWVTNDY